MADKNDVESRLAALAENNKRLAEQNEKLMAALESKLAVADASGGLTREDFLVGMQQAMSAASKTSELIASKHKPENVDHLHKGPFEHPLGGLQMPKPAYHRQIIWGRPLPQDELTYAEVLAVNALSQSLGRSERRLSRNGKWKAVVSDDNASVLISLPVRSADDRSELPSFTEICVELTSGEKPTSAADVMAELVMLRASVAALQGAATA